MPQNEIILRSASPTREDGQAFATLLDRSAEGFFRFWLGPNVEEILTTVYAQPGHDLSYQHATFAERNGAIVGMALAYTAEQHRLASKEPLKLAAGKYRRRIEIIAVLLGPLMRITDSVPMGDFYLQAIAVKEGLDGKGVGSILLDSVDSQAISTGSARLSLDVSAKNERARKLYEYRGMTIESQWPKHLPISAIRFYRMTKTL